MGSAVSKLKRKGKEDKASRQTKETPKTVLKRKRKKDESKKIIAVMGARNVDNGRYNLLEQFMLLCSDSRDDRDAMTQKSELLVKVVRWSCCKTVRLLLDENEAYIAGRYGGLSRSEEFLEYKRVLQFDWEWDQTEVDIAQSREMYQALRYFWRGEESEAMMRDLWDRHWTRIALMESTRYLLDRLADDDTMRAIFCDDVEPSVVCPPDVVRRLAPRVTNLSRARLPQAMCRRAPVWSFELGESDVPHLVNAFARECLSERATKISWTDIAHIVKAYCGSLVVKRKICDEDGDDESQLEEWTWFTPGRFNRSSRFYLMTKLAETDLLIYVTSLASYAMRAYDEDDTNLLDEDLSLFQEFCTYRLMEKKPFVLALTRKQLLRRLIEDGKDLVYPFEGQARVLQAYKKSDDALSFPYTGPLYTSQESRTKHEFEDKSDEEWLEVCVDSSCVHLESMYRHIISRSPEPNKLAAVYCVDVFDSQSLKRDFFVDELYCHAQHATDVVSAALR